MSLIPSESYSFPDHFTSTVTPSRKPKKDQPAQAPVDMRRKKPSIVALPDPKPEPAPAPAPAPAAVRENAEPVRSKGPVPAPNPALRRASAPPPRVPEPPKRIALPPTLKPKVRWNTRAPAMDPAPMTENGAEHVPQEMPAAPAQNVIPMKPIRAVRPPRMMPPPETSVPRNDAPVAAPKPEPVMQTPRRAPAPAVPQNARPVAVPNPQEDFFEMFVQSGETALAKRGRKAKMRRFIVCESAVLAVLLPLAILGLAHRPDNVALIWMMNILTIALAVAAALIPILFFAVIPTLPEIED